MNVRKEAYLTLVKKLEELNSYKTIDLWKSQVNNPKESNPIVYPAAFVSIEAINWNDGTLNIKEGELTLNIYLFYNRGSDTFSTATDLHSSLKILDDVQETINGLQWIYKENCFTELTLTREQDVTERFKRPAFVLTFNANCFQTLKNPDYVYK